MYAPSMHYHYQRASFRRCSTFNPFVFLFIIMCAPTLCRLALCLIAPVIHFGLIFGTISLFMSLLDETTCDKVDERSARRSASEKVSSHNVCNLRACFSKMKATAKEVSACGDSCACGDDKREPAIKKNASVEEAALRRRDLSSV